MMERKQRNRFSFQDDLFLLKEVVGHNPFEEFSRWEIVCENVRLTSGKNFSLRAIKEHVEHLLQLYIKNGRGSLRKTLTEEQYNEKDRLLKEAKEMWIEFKKNYQMKKKEKNLERQRGVEVRNDSVSNDYITDNDTKVHLEDHNSTDPLEDEKLSIEEMPHPLSPLHNYEQSPTTSYAESTAQASSSTLDIKGPIRVRNSRNWIENSSLQFLREKQEWERSIRERELHLQERKLEIEERKLKLEEEKFQLEKEERTKRLQIEIKERENNMTMLQQQQNIISYFLNSYNKQ